MSFTFRFVLQSNVGVIRKSNEDCAIASPKFLAVADGMGGHAAGEVASSTIIRTFQENLETIPVEEKDFQDWLVATTNLAHSTIGDLVAADGEKRGMGTTFSAITIVDNKIGIGHIGDSRIYRLRDGIFSQISIDHTYVQSLVDSGELTPEEAANHPRRNLLIRAIDGIHDVVMDIELLETKVGDRFLVCSDGLTGVISDSEIAKQLAKPDLTSAVSQLIEMTLAGGAPDNVTIAVAEVIAEDELLDSGIRPIVVGAFEVNEEPSRPQTEQRNLFIPKIAAALVALLIGIFMANSWLTSQWYVAPSNGRVAVFQGINQELGPISFSSLIVETELPVSALTSNDLSLISDGISISNLESGLVLIQEMWSRSTSCESAVAGCNP